MRRPANPAQGVLYGLQSVHVGRYARSPSLRVCALCKVLLAVSATWECSTCPGWVEPAPPWAVLGEYTGALETLEAA